MKTQDFGHVFVVVYENNIHCVTNVDG